MALPGERGTGSQIRCSPSKNHTPVRVKMLLFCPDSRSGPGSDSEAGCLLRAGDLRKGPKLPQSAPGVPAVQFRPQSGSEHIQAANAAPA